MEKVRGWMGRGDQSQVADEEEGGILADVDAAITLSWANRVKAFAAAFVLGVFLSLLGTLFWYLGNVRGFGILFSFGTLVSMASTCFLMGPWKQVQKMFALSRLIPTIVVFLCMALTIVAAVVLKNGLLVILFVVLQYVAMAWYSISYIPFARDAVEKCLCACLD